MSDAIMAGLSPAQLIERAGDWHMTPAQHLIMRLNARQLGLDVGDPFAAWQAYRRFHSNCPVCKG